MSEADRDVLGNALTGTERRLLEAHGALESLHADPELSPTAKANVSEALAALWQALHNLALTDERPAL